MFILRAQLKTSFKAQQKAQISEKGAANSKKRFISCMLACFGSSRASLNFRNTDIFHEVRVPLNSALLAYQNLQANGAFTHCELDQGVEIHARTWFETSNAYF